MLLHDGPRGGPTESADAQQTRVRYFGKLLRVIPMLPHTKQTEQTLWRRGRTATEGQSRGGGGARGPVGARGKGCTRRRPIAASSRHTPPGLATSSGATLQPEALTDLLQERKRGYLVVIKVEFIQVWKTE